MTGLCLPAVAANEIVRPSMTFDIADFVRSLAAVVLFASVSWLAYALARRLCATPSTRLAASAIAALWLMVATFWLLAPWGLFRLELVLVLFLGAAIGLSLSPLARRAAESDRSLWSDLAEDLHRIGSTLRILLRRPAGWVLTGVMAVSALRALRGSISPPLGWDALTYHLLKAARFVQAGGPIPESAPDAWRYYEFYPPTGDVVWAWAMLPLSSDALLSLAGWGLWMTSLLAIWTCSRQLGASRNASALAAAAIGALPSALTYLSSSYVDVMVLALFALGTVFVVRIATGDGPLREAPLAAGALGLMVGVKLTAAPFFLIGAIVVLWRLLRPANGDRAALAPRVRTMIFAACLVAAIAGAPPYLRAWVSEGSPVWPFTVKVAGSTLFQGDPGMQKLAEGEMLSERYLLPDRAEFWKLFLWQRTSEGAFVNPGPGSIVIVGLALLALPGLLRRPRLRTAALFLAACGLVMLAGAMSKNMELFRTTVKAATFGRYLLPAFAAAAILSASRPSASEKKRLTEIGLAVAALSGLLLAWPRGWQPEEHGALVGGLAAFASLGVALGSLALGLVQTRVQGRRRLFPIAIALLAGTFGIYQIEAVASAHRYELWRTAAQNKEPLFHMHRLHPVYAGAWPIWQGLDDPDRPRRLAVTAGWDRLGHNWYRYPLLGSRFQNEVVYVPITPDGSIVDYRLIGRADNPAAQQASSLPHWLARLAQAQIEVVVSLAPRWTVEDSWMQSRPDLFTPILGDERGFHVAYRFDREAAIGWLNELAPGQ